jgi:hypothetical protein
MTQDSPLTTPQWIALGLMLGLGVYLVVVVQTVFLLTLGRPVQPGPPVSAANVFLALGALLPVYAIAGTIAGLGLAILKAARRTVLGWMLSASCLGFMLGITSAVAGRVSMAVAGINLVDSDSPVDAWPFGQRDLVVIVVGGAVIGFLAHRFLPRRG